jgi:2-dehydro-3-deoxy-D-arabinonate dehydratase
MKICRFLDPLKGIRLGAVVEGAVRDLTAAGDGRFASLEALLSFVTGAETAPRCDASARPGGVSPPLRQALADCAQRAPVAASWSELARGATASGLRLLAPIDQQEVWGAGVTYTRSREAREQESGDSRLYDRVYRAERPELFFKATPSRVAGPGEAVCLRGDSRWTVPEPELALVLNSDLQLVGFTLGNDVTARDVEGENALYLPQAKVFSGCCALGPAIVLADEMPNPEKLEVRCRIERGGQTILDETFSVGRMKRSLAELMEYLGRDNAFPHGVVLLTGTGMVPPDDLALADGDVVEISADDIGVLVNPVRQLPAPVALGAGRDGWNAAVAKPT